MLWGAFRYRLIQTVLVSTDLVEHTDSVQVRVQKYGLYAVLLEYMIGLDIITAAGSPQDHIQTAYAQRQVIHCGKYIYRQQRCI